MECTSGREPGDLAANDQVDIEIETVGLERGAIPLLHLPHLRTDIADGFVKRLADSSDVCERDDSR